jgi:hypothetical protein
MHLIGKKPGGKLPHLGANHCTPDAGNTMVSKYEGTLSGDELKLKVTRDTPNGAMTSELTAKRSTT